DSFWYGDVGIAGTGDGGAVMYYSQSNQEYGLFALRFGPSGDQTTGVPAAPARLALRSARFDGHGLVVSFDLPRDAAGRLELFDVLGRRLADLRLTAADGGAREVELHTNV